MTKTVEAKYTEAQETELLELADAGPLNKEIATRLAERWGKQPRAVIAKIVSMKLPYTKQVRLSKTGIPVESKADMVARIAKHVPGNLTGLENAPKEVLRLIADFVEG